MKNLSLYSIYGVRIASNPHARNWVKMPLASPRLGNRKFRRTLAAAARHSDVASELRSLAQ